MKIERTIEVQGESFIVGDIISFELNDGEKVEAVAVKQDGDTMIFCHVDCLKDEYPMNDRNTNKGGYEASKLRTTLRDVILPRYPEELVKKMVPFKNGDLLRIPTEKEIFGRNVYGDDEPEEVTQWEPMKLRRNRIAFQGSNGDLEWYWLQNPVRDVVSAAYFADVSAYGDAHYLNASNAYIGVRPAFGIHNL